MLPQLKIIFFRFFLQYFKFDWCDTTKLKYKVFKNHQLYFYISKIFLYIQRHNINPKSSPKRNIKLEEVESERERYRRYIDMFSCFPLPKIGDVLHPSHVCPLPDIHSTSSGTRYIINTGVYFIRILNLILN